MAGDEHSSRRPPARNPGEDKLLFALRLISAVVFLGLVVLASIVQVSGHPVGDVFFGTLTGCFVLLLGIEVVARLPGIR